MESAASRVPRFNPDANSQDKYQQRQGPKPTSMTPTTIITCPACRTRFAVGTSAISAVEDPRFHCSRCDALFSLSELPLLREEVQQQELLQEAFLPAEEEPPYVETPEEEAFTPIPNFSVQKQEILNMNDFSLRTSSSIETPGLDIPEPSMADPAHHEPERMSFEADVKRTPEKQVHTSKILKGTSSWYGCWFFLSLLLSALTFFSVITYLVGLDPVNVSQAITAPVPAFLEPSHAVPPPPELVISRSKFDVIELESGTKIPVVTGRLANTGNDRFSSVEIEGLMFDGKGQVIASEKAPLRSALGREKITALDLETIGRFQRSVAGKASNIDSKQRVDFVIAFPGLAKSEGEPSAASPRSFSVRVYQVKR